MAAAMQIAWSVSGAAALLALGACTDRGPVPEPDFTALPAIAAQYQTETFGGGAVERVEWRFWRAPDRLWSDNLADRTGERWQRDGRVLFHQKLFHDDARGIHFQMHDLGMFGPLPAWVEKALLVDPALLAALPVTKAGWRDGHPFRRYAGEVDGVAWDITLRVDLLLPTVIERARGGLRQRTRLQAAHALAEAPWQPTPSTRYELIDFADLGDRETDPFVQKVQRRLGVAHSH
jgi:hypothetical protein